MPTAAIVVEVVSPHVRAYAKFDFYAGHGVDELLVADPDAKTVRCWHLGGTGYEQSAEGRLLDLAMADLTAQIHWP